MGGLKLEATGPGCSDIPAQCSLIPSAAVARSFKLSTHTFPSSWRQLSSNINAALFYRSLKSDWNYFITQLRMPNLVILIPKKEYYVREEPFLFASWAVQLAQSVSDSSAMYDRDHCSQIHDSRRSRPKTLNAYRKHRKKLKEPHELEIFSTCSFVRVIPRFLLLLLISYRTRKSHIALFHVTNPYAVGLICTDTCLHHGCTMTRNIFSVASGFDIPHLFHLGMFV